eukprot:scaffold38308_cov34-Attheya_sp.AAC.7
MNGMYNILNYLFYNPLAPPNTPIGVSNPGLVNEGHHIILYKIGDAMMAVASDATAAGIMGKLTYQSRGPFEIVEDLSFGAYIVRRLANLTPLPATPYSTFDAFPLPPLPLLLHDLHASTPVTAFTPPEPPRAPPITSSTAAAFLLLLHASVDRLCFIRYTPTIGTLRPHWYLVQADLVDTAVSLPDFATTGMYSVNFLTRHSDNNHLSDSSTQWWPEWHNNTNPPSGLCLSHIIRYRHSTHPDPSKLIRYTDEVPLLFSHCQLLGPFEFEPCLDTVRPKQIVPASIWDLLTQLCLDRGVQPPTVGGQHISRPRYGLRTSPQFR